MKLKRHEINTVCENLFILEQDGEQDDNKKHFKKLYFLLKLVYHKIKANVVKGQTALIS